MIVKLVKFAVGLLLLPLCLAITRSLLSLILAIEPDSDTVFPAAGVAMTTGFLLWLAVYVFLPRPVRTYVLAHELTHALWGSLMGARIHSIRVRKDAGSVTLSKTNFLITLAPYFFPLYTVLAIVAYFIAGLFWNIQQYHLFWLGLVGFTWSFHCTFTLATLLQRQSDIREGGRLFSYTVIYLFNILGVALWVVLVSSVTLGDFLRFAVRDAVNIWATLAAWLAARFAGGR